MKYHVSHLCLGSSSTSTSLYTGAEIKRHEASLSTRPFWFLQLLTFTLLPPDSSFNIWFCMFTSVFPLDQFLVVHGHRWYGPPTPACLFGARTGDKTLFYHDNYWLFLSIHECCTVESIGRSQIWHSSKKEQHLMWLEPPTVNLHEHLVQTTSICGHWWLRLSIFFRKEQEHCTLSTHVLKNTVTWLGN